MSGTFCVAWGCFNRQKKGKSFHRFPKDEERRRQWVAALKREGFQATDYTRICGDHFEKQCYNPSGLLKHTAVPTIFNCPAHLQKEVKTRTNQAPRNLTTESSMPMSSSPSPSFRPETGAPGTSGVAHLDQNASSLSLNTMATRKRGGQTCGAINCTNGRHKNPGKSFFRYPIDEERCRIWVQNSRREDLIGKSPADLRKKGLVICADHFDGNQFQHVTERNRLMHYAVPTLFYADKDQQGSAQKTKLCENETEVSDGSDPTARVIEAKEPGIVGTCIQMAVYLLKTMEEFEFVEYEVRYLPKSQQPVLHLRRRDLYGKLGWPGDPVTTTLTMQGLLTHRVVYCAPRSDQLTHGNKLVVDKFISEMRWLTSVTALCLGVSRDITPTAQSLPGLVSLSSPEPRVQSESCPLVLHGQQRRCPGCRQQAKDQRSQHNDTGDPQSSNDSDDTLPVYFETDESSSQRKTRQLSKANPSVLRKHKRSKPNSSSVLLPTEIGVVRNMHSDDSTEPSDIGCETGSVNLSTSVMRSTHSGITEPSDNGSMSLSTTDAGELHNSIAIKVEPDTIKEEPDYDGIYIENDRAEEDMLVGDTHSSYVTCKQESLNLSASFTFQPPTAVHKGVADTVTQDSIATTAVQDNGAVTAVHSNLAATVAQDSEAATATEDSIEASVVLNGLIIKRDPDYDDSELETDDTFVGIKQDSSWKQDSSVFDLHTNSVTHSHLSTSDPRSIPSSPGTDWVSLPIQQEPTEPPAVTHTHSDDSNYCLWLQHIHHKT